MVRGIDELAVYGGWLRNDGGKLDCITTSSTSSVFFKQDNQFKYLNNPIQLSMFYNTIYSVVYFKRCSLVNQYNTMIVKQKLYFYR